MVIMWNPFEVILSLLMLLLWMCSSSSEARTLDSVRVFIVEEDAYNYLQNYLHQYDMKKGTEGKEVEERRVAIIMGIPKKKGRKGSNDLPAPIKGFYETDRRLDEEQLTEPSASYAMPPPGFRVQQQQFYRQPDPMVDQMEQLASSISPDPFFDDYEHFDFDDTGYNHLGENPHSSVSQTPLIQYRQSYFPSHQIIYHLFKKK